MTPVGTTHLLLAMIIGTVIPLLNGLLTRYGASRVRVYLGLVLSAANGLLTEGLAGGESFNWAHASLAAFLSLVTALSVEAKVWAPLGVSEAVKSAGVK